MSTLEVQVSVTDSGAVAIKEDPRRLQASIEETKADWKARLPADEPLSDSVQFGIMRHPLLKVVRGIPVKFHRDGAVFVASWEELEEFGYGQTRSQAIEDFGQTISQLFITLDRDKESLGPHLQETLATLRGYIQFRG